MSMEQTHNKSFFEKYQNFIALVICGALIGGGIIVSKVISPNSGVREQKQVTQSDIRKEMLGIAKKLELDKSKFAACIDQGTYKQKITDAVTLAEQSGVQGTPTFFVVKRTFDTEGKIVREKQWSILGARDRATFDASIKNESSPAGQPAINGDKIILAETDHWMGPKDASIVIVEYADIDCYYCQQVKPTIDQLLKDNPEYAFVYRHSPIASLHPWAEYKAQASECAASLGNGDETFFKFLDLTTQ